MPQFSSNLPWPLASPILAAILNPIAANPLLQGKPVTGFVLQAGENFIPHGLQRIPNGWIITDINSSSVLFRSAPFTTTTLTLTASASATVSLWVF